MLCSEASDGKKIANGFNNFFASAAVRLKRALGSVSFKNRSVDQKVDGSIPNFKFELVNESLIVKTLQGLKESKASGLDNIQLFRERLSEKVHATILKGIVGAFKFTIL